MIPRVKKWLFGSEREEESRNKEGSTENSGKRETDDKLNIQDGIKFYLWFDCLDDFCDLELNNDILRRTIWKTEA